MVSIAIPPYETRLPHVSAKVKKIMKPRFKIMLDNET
nr:MAG TPA: hypothetical protein [Caudoviricetes sp.]